MKKIDVLLLTGMLALAFSVQPVAAVTYTLTITATVGGETDPSPGTYPYAAGTVVLVTGLNVPNFRFEHWELDGNWNYCNPISVTMDSDHTLHAVFHAGSANDENGDCVQQTSDGGYIIVGDTETFGAGATDVYLVKTDSKGAQQWHKAFGSGDFDFGECVRQTSDGGYIIVGDAQAYSACDVYLVKTDPNGNEQWHRTFSSSEKDRGKWVQQTGDGGYIIVGATNFATLDTNIYLIKTYSNGNEQWHRTLGGSDNVIGYCVQQTSDGGYIIVGQAFYGEGNYDVYLIKTYSNGNEEWHKTFGGSGEERGISVQQTTDGGYIIAGRTTSLSAGGEPDVYLIKTYSNGNQEWYRTFGGSESDLADCVQQTSDGGYIIAGSTKSFGGGDWDVYLIKTYSDGTLHWQRTFGGSEYGIGEFVQQTGDGGYIIVGTRMYGWNRDAYLIKTYSGGSEQWYRTFPPPTRWLTISTADGGTTNPVPGSHTYLDGSSVEVTAIPDTDYVLDHWELDGNIGAANPCLVLMDDDHTLDAVFVSVPTIPTIPTVSEWGLIIMAVLLLTAGAIVIRRQLRVPA